jgi:oligopeptide transport system ATP-binding protein
MKQTISLPSQKLIVNQVRDKYLLQVHNLQVSFSTEYGRVEAVNNISFNLALGETLGIVGESGCGKTISMLAIMRLIECPPGKIDGGEAFFNGTNLLTLSSDLMRSIRGKRIAMIFQDPMSSLNPVFTIGDQIGEAISSHENLSRREIRKKVIELLDLVGIPQAAKALDDYPHQFSGGMRQRAMIAMALSCKPDLLIADEPTTALDVTVQEQLLTLMKNLQKQFRMSMIWITHDLGVVAGIADRINVMYAGKIIETGSVFSIFEVPRHPYTFGLLNSIPRLDIPKQDSLLSIPGVPPDMINLPKGCAFAPRCTYKTKRCLEEIPPLLEIGHKHSTACWENPNPTKNKVERNSIIQKT